MRKQSEPPGSFLLPDDDVIDPLAVELALTGQRRVGLTRAERIEVIRRVRDAGQPDSRARYLLGINRDGYRMLRARLAELEAKERQDEEDACVAS